jgi:DNA polymerase (family 10)
LKKNELHKIDGFGKALVEKLTDLIQNGRMEYYNKIIDDIPESLIELTKLEGLGTKKNWSTF